MPDFDKLSIGKDQQSEPGLIINGVYYSNSDLIKALGKVLIQKGLITKAEVLGAI